MKFLNDFFFIAIIFTVNIPSSFAQNLIPNSSFELPLNFEKENTTNWMKCLKSDTPDYFCFKGREMNVQELNDFIGGIQPQDGSSYIGIFCYRINPYRGIDNIREFIQVKLEEPLERDSIYIMSLYLALDPESNIAINNLNVCFGKEPVKRKKEKQMFSMVPQVSYQKKYYDNYNWEKVEFEFKAWGWERYCIIGNFLPDKKLLKKEIQYPNTENLGEKWQLAEKEKAAYYYIDNVNLRLMSNLKEPGIIPRVNEEEKSEPDHSSFDLGTIEVGEPVILKNILFEFDKDKLLPESFEELDRLYKLLFENPDIKIIIEGHTDNIGGYDYNIDLSIRRAKAVVEYLKNKGISQNRLKYEGFGYTRPFVTNYSEEDRHLNRRVAFKIVQ